MPLPAHHRLVRTATLVAFTLPPTLSMAGCAGWFSHAFGSEGATVHFEGLGAQPASLDGVLPFGAYGSTASEHSMYASDVPLEDLLAGKVANGQFLHAQLLWEPKPGTTPVDPTATNVVLRFVVVSDGKLGVYGGAGFAWPRGKVGVEPLSLVINGSSIALLASNEGFVDPLTPAQLTGTVWARFDQAAMQRFRRGVSQLVTDGLGESRWVDRQAQPLTAAQVVALLDPRASDPRAASTSVETLSR